MPSGATAPVKFNRSIGGVSADAEAGVCVANPSRTPLGELGVDPNVKTDGPGNSRKVPHGKQSCFQSLTTCGSNSRNESGSLSEAERCIQTNLSCCGRLGMQLLSFSKANEASAGPTWDYMELQTNITPDMRAVLVDWLMEVDSVELQSESGREVFLAVRILDTYLSSLRRPILRRDLQMVGVASLMLATKYEVDGHFIRPSDAAALCDGAYRVDEIVAMEVSIFASMGFSVGVPTTIDFLNFFMKASPLLAETEGRGPRWAQFCFLCLYCAEASMMYMHLHIQFRPSEIAAASVAIAHDLLGVDSWGPALAEMTGRSRADLMDCAACVLACVEDFTLSDTPSPWAGRGGPFLRAKYSSPRAFNVVGLIRERSQSRSK
uniref:Cyclin a n=1 Tax=Tetraselmis sp. GSL018 TaxID=582737 RepID=A0A061SCR0_9CHLO|mmetsp:Transcript_24911/g.59268  ORF Transcript_24911/g.59268 Transcript_24911/m.59268 type:complete len:378 (+) Transcript_24911:234-1367(+)|eukprot:CAMPEP_0177616404 /NCGR_PEP_ID=MMETSP0419_2-20121207/24130_1 /TAXON_ID=582737 /ORGANISM="Tetraselmis sp., Strain GSL018" /LENGTH=377 /DNA_ID=CAMNT_0019114445 /DNA_START=196 /DNA_END=1329 /DNA_ORIENTATION=+